MHNIYDLIASKMTDYAYGFQVNFGSDPKQVKTALIEDCFKLLVKEITPHAFPILQNTPLKIEATHYVVNVMYQEGKMNLIYECIDRTVGKYINFIQA